MKFHILKLTFQHFNQALYLFYLFAISIQFRKIKKPNKQPKVKQKKIKDDNPPQKDGAIVLLRKKSGANTSGASIMNGVARMSAKDRKLLKMILVIFLSFLTCYLPITLTKIMRSIADVHFVFIMSYLLIYLSTCINPIIYVVMSNGKLQNCLFFKFSQKKITKFSLFDAL
jgi:hypothetical protein